MKSLSIAMAASVLMLASAHSSADSAIQKDMKGYQTDESRALQMSSDNRNNSLSERRIYKKTVDASRQIGSATEGSKNAKIQKASEDIINQLKKEVDGKTPEEFIALIKRMEADSKFSFNLTQAIGTQNKKEANALLMKATGINMNIEYTDTNSEIMSLKLCAYRNGVKRCFPSQRNSVKCAKF
jgi:hypothetical protein